MPERRNRRFSVHSGLRWNCAGQTEATPKQILTLGHSPPSQRRFWVVAPITAIRHHSDLPGCPKKAPLRRMKGARTAKQTLLGSFRAALGGIQAQAGRKPGQSRANSPPGTLGSVPQRGFSSVSLQSVPIPPCPDLPPTGDAKPVRDLMRDLQRVNRGEP
jgi:hypothetical protein